MANIESQRKRILRSERERQENLRYKSKIKTFFRHLEESVEAGDSDTAAKKHRELVKTIDKAVKRTVMHRNTGARKKSRAARILAGKAVNAPEKKAPTSKSKPAPSTPVEEKPEVTEVAEAETASEATASEE